jgi:hypothetical protein
MDEKRERPVKRRKADRKGPYLPPLGPAAGDFVVVDQDDRPGHFHIIVEPKEEKP